MKKHMLILGLAPVLALGACGGGADNTADTNVTNTDVALTTDNALAPADNAMLTDEAATPSQKFANDVGASDFYEIQAGQLAQERASAQGVKDFGAMLVKDHTTSTEKLKAAGGKADPAIVPNPVLNADQEASLAALRAAEGAAFDAAFKTQQIAAHEKALAILKGYAASGDVPELKAFAAEAQKVVETHLAELKGM